jgi:hypothetical protein
MTADFDELADRLDAISEELADLALAHLREALDANDDAAAAAEKRLTRARRAVEKASGLLRGVGESE